jgi:hypothetical protein
MLDIYKRNNAERFVSRNTIDQDMCAILMVLKTDSECDTSVILFP